jgi:uncharacterized delta-60 repeat protein
VTPNAVDNANAIGMEPDGRIVVAGDTGGSSPPNSVALGRYTTNGSLDPTFNGTGIVVTSFGSSASGAKALAIQPADSKILVAGYGPGDGQDFVTLRYLGDSPTAPAAVARTAAIDSLFADMRAVAILLSSDNPANKH